ncbi:MAG: hypothetical protein JSW64_15340, partial [Candidatus Zixiibacteriota bacterium]
SPPLNTSGELELIVEHYFSVSPTAPGGIYPLEITVDPYTGPIIFGDVPGSQEWTPIYQNGFVRILADVEDSVYVGYDSVLVREQVVIPVSVLSDEEIDYINIPISYDNFVLFFVGCQLYGDIVYWDDISVVDSNEIGIVTIYGEADTGGSANPFLDTGGIREVIAELYFATNPEAAIGTYPLEITTDPVTGPISFRDSSGLTWAPPYRNGFAYLDLPPSCDLRFDYLWAPGVPRSPSSDRHYYSEIRNVGYIAAENVELVITIPSEFVYLFSVPTASELNGTMTWSVGTIYPGEAYHVEWFVEIPGGLDSIFVHTIGDIYTTTYDIVPANNHRVFEEQVGLFPGLSLDLDLDPNDKTVDPVGVMENHFVTGEAAFQYTIYFENESFAVPYATDMIITDALDNNLDWWSFLPALISHPDSCSAYIDQGTGIVTLDCDSIFLEPDSGGFFLFIVDSRWDISTGTTIQNEAYIQFDAVDPIVAPQDGPVFNTIDKTMPISFVEALPDTIQDTSFTVSWNSDDGEGSGVAYYDIYVSVDGGPFSLWLDDTTVTSEIFTGEREHEYAFYSVATDNVNITEIHPPQPDARVFIGPETYVVGDVNHSGEYNGLDITYGVAYFKQGPEPLCDSISCPPHSFFWVCGDVNGSCSYNGLDITYGVNYFKNGPDPYPCPDCPPAE